MMQSGTGSGKSGEPYGERREPPYCFRHPSTPAVAMCVSCARPVCRECARSEGYLHYCSECLHAPPVSPGVEKVAGRRSRLERNAIPPLKLLLIFLLPLVFLLRAVPTGYLLESPGPSFDLQQDLTVRGTETYDSDGEFLLTAVRLEEASLIYYLGSFIIGDFEPVSIRDYLGEDLDTREQETVNEMITLLSEDASIVVALGKAGKQVEVKGLGALVLYVFEDFPAHESLKPGEVIVSVNGEAVANTEAVKEAIDSAPPGEEISLGVKELYEEALERADEDESGARPDNSGLLKREEREVKVQAVYDPDRQKSVVGIVMRDYFTYRSDVKVTWDLEGVKGPSAGLMMTLSLINALTPGDLTGGRNIAGTGEIFLDGRVGPIGGLPMKIKAAEREGAEVFIYPLANQEDLAGVSTSLELYPVDNLQEALEVLEALEAPEVS